MFEINLFVNPLSEFCFKIEKELIKLAEKRKQFFRIHFIPIINFKKLEHILYNCFKHIISSEERNKIFKNIYSAILDVKAASLQGQKKGQNFLIKLQQKIIQEKQKDYSTNLAKELAEFLQVDIEMFLKDRQSPLVKKAFYCNQQKAKDLHLKSLPAATIFDFNSNEDGIIIENYFPEILNLLSQKNIDSIGQLLDALNHKYDIVFENKPGFQHRFKIAK
ncbi:MAG: DsbA family protein [Lactobacillales bacterium]|nr:DsbA family protein [Lactobacillales bacterium]